MAEFQGPKMTRPSKKGGASLPLRPHRSAQDRRLKRGRYVYPSAAQKSIVGPGNASGGHWARAAWQEGHDVDPKADERSFIHGNIVYRDFGLFDVTTDDERALMCDTM